MSEKKALPRLSAILKNPHFCQFAAFFHIPFMENMWSAEHPRVPARLLIQQMSDIACQETPLTMGDKVKFLAVFADFASQVVMEDMRLSYSEEDMSWLVEVLDSEQAKVTLALLFAVASSKETYFTPAEVASALHENEVVWRRKAERHEVPGAIKKSRGWLLPQSGLRSIGIEVSVPNEVLHREEEE